MLFKKKPKYPSIVVLTGIGRSGTTMLRKSLGLHSQIYYNGNENNIFIDMISTFHKNCTMPSRKVAMELSQPAYNEQVKQTIFNFLFPDKHKIKQKYVLIASALHTESISYLKVLFPNVHVLQIVRNGIEVVSSRMLYDGFKHNGFEDHVDKWNLGMTISDVCKDILKAQYKLVRHEHFLDLDNLKGQVADICKWLDIDFEENVFNSISQTKFHPTVVEVKDSENLKDRNNRWTTWTVAERTLFKEKAASNMEALGYKMPF